MLRAVLTTRGGLLTALAAASVVVMIVLGAWQWDRSRPVVDVDALETLPATEVVPEQGRVTTAEQGSPVSVEGRWRPDRQVQVADRTDPGGSGEPGRWVVTAVEVAPASGDRPATLLPVVRGWIPADPEAPAADVPAPPAGGPVDVTGWIQASEPLDTPVEVLQPDGVVALLSAADLVNRWPEHVLDAFVIAGPGSGTSALTGIAEVMPGPVQEARGTRDWRNVAYAAQWWVFAGFAVVLWWRVMGDLGGGGPVRGGDRTRERIPA